MYSEFDYLSAEILNDIETKIEALYKKYSDYTTTTYIPKIWQKNELVFVNDISNIEDSLEHLGNLLNYPNGWITSRNWDITGINNISYKDINRLLNNIEILNKYND